MVELPESGKVLIVEDCPMTLRVLSRMLVEAGHRTVLTQEGARAISLAREEAPDLILLDVGLPGMNGFEVCTQLKNMTETRDIPVIFITGMDEVRSEVRGLAHGAIDYIRKPFSRAAVLARVQAHLILYHTWRQLQLTDHLLEAALGESERAMSVIQADGTILRYNSPFARVAASAADEDLTGKDVAEALFGSTQAVGAEALVKALGCGERCRLTGMPVGTAGAADLNLIPMRMPSGQIAAFFVCVHAEHEAPVR
jgi:DNA-binding response OmpR family regulator